MQLCYLLCRITVYTPFCLLLSPRELLQRDEAVLRHLLQQELKKRESLKAAEAKVVKLREQLQASEKIVGANKMLLKKLQEQVRGWIQSLETRGLWCCLQLCASSCVQVHRVEHRVSIKKSVAARLEQELAQAQLAVGRGSKRRTDSNQSLVRNSTFTCVERSDSLFL